MLFKFENPAESEKMAYIITELIFLIFILYTILSMIKEKIYVTPTGVEAYYLFRKNLKMSWNEIANIYIRKLSSSMVITDHRGRKLKVNQFLTGYNTFVKIVVQRVPYEIHRNCIYGTIEC